jgi:hypothetical protein
MDHFLVEMAAPIPDWPNWKTSMLQLSEASTYTGKFFISFERGLFSGKNEGIVNSQRLLLNLICFHPQSTYKED